MHFPQHLAAEGARMAIFIAIIAWRCCDGEVDSLARSSHDSLCGPKVTVALDGTVIDLCLNRFEAGEDSCIDFTLRLQKPYCADVRFRCAFNRKWSFDSVVSPEPLGKLPPMHADVSLDDAGNLLDMRLVFGTLDDLTKMLLDAGKNSDLPTTLPDTAPAPVTYVLLRSAYQCVDRAVHGLVVHRTFSYPPDYKRREPAYNYPALSMFKCGRAVRMPTVHSLDAYADLIINWHILHPDPLTYKDEPMHCIDEEKMKKPARKKDGFIKIRPLLKSNYDR